MSVKPAKKPRKTLTGKQRTFVAEYISNGKNATRAALKAYPKQKYSVAQAVGSENLSKPLIQEAIEKALLKHELTPEFAVLKVKNVADMELDSKSAPSVLKASKTILELHGWRKDDRPSMTLNVNQFFSRSRIKQDQNIIDQ